LLSFQPAGRKLIPTVDAFDSNSNDLIRAGS
jgi:hypothetical protein